MKTLIKRVTFISLITMTLVYADNEGVVVPSNSGKTITQEQRIINNFKKIDKLFISINEKIKKIETLRESMVIMHQNKDNEVVCAVVDSLNRDINQLTIKIGKLKDEQKREEMQNKLDTHKLLRDEEKVKLDKLNHQCLL